jgi:hypothetical protein
MPRHARQARQAPRTHTCGRALRSTKSRSAVGATRRSGVADRAKLIPAQMMTGSQRTVRVRREEVTMPSCWRRAPRSQARP